MNNSRLLELLHAFSSEELTAFGKFIRSPFFNHREDVIRLFDYFFEKRELKGEEAFDKSRVFPGLFPGECYDEKKLNYTMSFLNRLAQQFLAYREWEKAGEAASRVYLARALRKKGITRPFDSALKKAEKALERHPFRDTDYHHISMLFYREQYEASATQRRTATRSFQEMADETDLYFISHKLRQSCTALMHRAVSETRYQLEFLDEALSLVEQKQLQTIPAIGIYYFAYRALTEPDSKPWFGRFRQAIQQHTGRFSPAEMRDIYTLAVNYCIRQINTLREAPSQSFFLQQVFDIYKEGLENEAFTEGGVLSRFTYNNIANAGLGLKAFDWVKAFLEQYRNRLEPEHRNSAYLFNLASLHFRKSEYDRVLELLTQAEFDDVLHQLDARRMLLRSYYELGEFSALDSLLDSFHNFLRRRRDVGYLRQNYLALIRFTRKLLQTPPGNQTAKEKLLTEIKEAKAAAEREWLLEKVRLL